MDDYEVVGAIRANSGNTVRAVEMESWGAAIGTESYSASTQRQVLFAMIRGLSDIVRPIPVAAPTQTETNVATANSEERDSWKQRAARHAARLAVALIQYAWPYDPRDTPVRDVYKPESTPAVTQPPEIAVDQRNPLALALLDSGDTSVQAQVSNLFDVQPIQTMGTNFYRLYEKDRPESHEPSSYERFFVRLEFHFWTQFAIAIVNLDLQYDAIAMPAD